MVYKYYNVLIVLALLFWSCRINKTNEHHIKPNIIFIMADDLGYFEQTKIKRPNLNKIAAKSMISIMYKDITTLFNKLTGLRIEDNTIVFFTRDNGLEYERKDVFFNRKGSIQAIRKDNRKLVWKLEGKPELYNLRKDIGESHNVVTYLENFTRRLYL